MAEVTIFPAGGDEVQEAAVFVVDDAVRLQRG